MPCFAVAFLETCLARGLLRPLRVAEEEEDDDSSVSFIIAGGECVPVVFGRGRVLSFGGGKSVLSGVGRSSPWPGNVGSGSAAVAAARPPEPPSNAGTSLEYGCAISSVSRPSVISITVPRT